MLNINPVNFVKFNNFYKTQPKITSGLASDVFVRSANNISFKGEKETNSSSFIEWAKQTGFVQKQLSEILSNPDCKLGSGFSHSAYIIPDNEEYILRMPNIKVPLEYDYSKASLKDTEDKNLKVNIGQEVASIEVPTKEGFPMVVEVLRKQSGDSIGVPPSQAVFVEETGALREGELSYEASERKEHYASTIHKVAQLPVESYEKLITDIREAEKAGYRFDHLNSNNLLVDEENESINLIDMDKSRVPANLGNVLYALTNICYFSTFSSKYDESPMSDDEIMTAIKDTMDITDKFIQAMQNKGEKFNRNECSYEFFNLMSSLPFCFYCKTGDDNAKWNVLADKGVVG